MPFYQTYQQHQALFSEAEYQWRHGESNIGRILFFLTLSFQWWMSLRLSGCFHRRTCTKDDIK